jgi:hypothetical protein
MVRELLSREEIHVAESPSEGPALSIGETTPEFLSACCRLLDLLNSPQDIPFLSGIIQREIIYRILRGPEGARLRSVATLGDQSHRTAKAIAWIVANYSKTLRVEDLAEISSMGVSTLHHHFRMLTSMSPLQYQVSPKPDAEQRVGCGQRCFRGGIRKPHSIQSRIQPLLWPAADAGYPDPPFARCVTHRRRC